MEKFKGAREKAERSLRIADHMLFITYPLINDNKLLISILENIFLAFTQSMASVLYYERLFKRVLPFHDNFESKFNLFSRAVAPRYNIDKHHLQTMVQVRDLVNEHKRSPMEFTRRGKYVICSQDYRLRTLSIDNLKDYVRTAKQFIQLNNRILEKDEHIFK